MKQIPVLSKILEKYHSLSAPDYAFRKINGLELCQFYNNFVVSKIKRTDSYEVDKMIDEVAIDHDVVVSLIGNDINI
jgi:hypothetical protein